MARRGSGPESSVAPWLVSVAVLGLAIIPVIYGAANGVFPVARWLVGVVVALGLVASVTAVMQALQRPIVILATRSEDAAAAKELADVWASFVDDRWSAARFTVVTVDAASPVPDWWSSVELRSDRTLRRNVRAVVEIDAAMQHMKAADRRLTKLRTLDHGVIRLEVTTASSDEPSAVVRKKNGRRVKYTTRGSRRLTLDDALNRLPTELAACI